MADIERRDTKRQKEAEKRHREREREIWEI